MNISCAANLAAKRAYQKLLRLPEVSGNQVQIYLDGGLFLGNKLDSLNLGAKTVIRGDEKIKAIKLASIVAKVSRDRYMVRLHKKDGAYGFDEHKGYGTKRHIQAIKKHRPSANHRLTFVKNYHKI
ncbi:MAG: Ribonuclease HII [Candidatus Jorgensenbacteria bacterium GW2011_GWA1_48_11]|uniref:Ribonuclease n=1 Tax=Candidatus Jorgensenbacteria bacterium GW2011_GWA1_48_11 TaxID=1618660 RepID=A0A0G1U9J8_9BACT|nr:MAG: Ribonuclease HII [Candidatus Jorgensenbacteria bacterium GW2011_GWA1_48_11]